MRDVVCPRCEEVHTRHSHNLSYVTVENEEKLRCGHCGEVFEPERGEHVEWVESAP